MKRTVVTEGEFKAAQLGGVAVPGVSLAQQAQARLTINRMFYGQVICDIIRQKMAGEPPVPVWFERLVYKPRD
ncbi:MAG: hypothetical protein ACTHLW_16185 [Verrucomicrobiota bacterium]